jgi:hypothetical protein
MLPACVAKVYYTIPVDFYSHLGFIFGFIYSRIGCAVDTIGRFVFMENPMQNTCIHNIPLLAGQKVYMRNVPFTCHLLQTLP